MTEMCKRIRQEDVPELIGSIVDVFEDFLEEKGVTLENSDKRDAISSGDDPESIAIIYGSDYGALQDDLTSLLSAWNII